MSVLEKEIIDAALKIGKRLCRRALWNDNKCTWEISTFEKNNFHTKKAKKAIASGSVYQGTAGIALFLSELFKITNNKELRDTSLGAIEFALKEAENRPNNSFGFYNGTVGVAYSAMRVSENVQRHEIQRRTLNCLLKLRGNEEKDTGSDVIGGAGGAIPALIKMFEYFKDEFIIEIAHKLADSLIIKAKMEAHGWSWAGTQSGECVRNLCGYAHGASGIGHAFLELYNITGSSYYLYAAEQAFLYERQFFIPAIKNWPDFRNNDLGEYIYSDKINELREAIENKRLQPYNPHFMSAWCHGAPGIGLVRLRMYELTNHQVYLDESVNACENTLASINRQDANYSLCHGLSGNSETLLAGYKILKDERYINTAINVALEGIKKYENSGISWPCGTIGQVSDPSLMLGEAGIGYFLLRLYSDEIPSVLMINSNSRIIEHEVIKKDYRTLQENYIKSYFGNTVKSLSETQGKNICKEIDFTIGKQSSDITDCYLRLSSYIKETNEKSTVAANYLLDKTKYLLSISINDFTEDYISSIMKKSFSKYDIDNTLFRLNQHTRLIEAFGESDVVQTEEGESKNKLSRRKHYAFYNSSNKILVCEISEIAFIILKQLKVSISLKEIVKEVSKHLEIDNPADLVKLNKIVYKQLMEAYNANIVNVFPYSPFEEYIVEILSSNFFGNSKELSLFQKSKYVINQTIRYLDSHLSVDDTLYRRYQMVTFTLQISTALDSVFAKHYFQHQLSEYLSKNDQNSLKSLIEDLKIVYGDYSNCLMIEQ